MPSENTGDIVGRVMTVGGEPIKFAAVMITGDSPEHQDIAVLTSEDGSYVYKNLKPGKYTLMVNSEKYSLKTSQVMVSNGKVTRLNFILEP